MKASAENMQAGGSQPAGADQVQAAIQFRHQAEKLSLQPHNAEHPENIAVNAQFITPQDAVVVTADGNRLPGPPLQEAFKLNELRDGLDSNHSTDDIKSIERATHDSADQGRDATGPTEVESEAQANSASMQKANDGSLQRTMPPSHTNPLFPPLPLYGPSSVFREVQCMTFRVSSFFLSTGFLGVVVLGALFTSIPPLFYRTWMRLTLRNPDARRPFYEEEMRRKKARQEMDRAWKRRKTQDKISPDKEAPVANDGFVPTEGGPDPIVCDVGYYARRVGLDMEEFQVQTEDGFIIDLWHIYDPKEHTKLDEKERTFRGPNLFTGETKKRPETPGQKRKFPVLLLHGLMQSSGAYCVNDEDSLAFYLCKSGYDVWLGNNRCGFKPKHVLLEYADPRMWCWNIRQMGVFDLAALTSRVLYETGFEKLGLICHSQGTTQTFVALAKEQRPELGEKISVFCALAPATHAGPLIGKAYFKFMRVISPAMFRVVFGIHAFIPLMMTMHGVVPARIYGWLGYKVFSFLFDWADTRWDRALKNRMFQFAPVYVSAESMRWWLGRECFAKHKCILSTKEDLHAEEREDAETDGPLANPTEMEDSGLLQRLRSRFTSRSRSRSHSHLHEHHHKRQPKGATAWYNEQAPPMALWVAGNDDLVDGSKLIRRFERGREPHVQIVHQKTIVEYEHLDVIWAMDAVDQVFSEVREVLWKTCNVRDQCRVPKGCETVGAWTPTMIEPDAMDADQSSSDSASEHTSK
ncbi:uncharacterized protein PG986_007937 [Apiospora aurea]|uniref:Partial AB-hydrolase lipase domain-containing protein n=1 Tax=Apiospora aurea TaxID=335848 RepID=A0ABR1QE06_9PEZI